jgi:hypothetical protein
MDHWTCWARRSFPISRSSSRRCAAFLARGENADPEPHQHVPARDAELTYRQGPADAGTVRALHVTGKPARVCSGDELVRIGALLSAGEWPATVPFSSHPRSLNAPAL